ERTGAGGHAERSGGDAEGDRGDVQPPHGPTVVDAPSGTPRECHLAAERRNRRGTPTSPDQDDRKITWGRRRECSSAAVEDRPNHQAKWHSRGVPFGLDKPARAAPRYAGGAGG